MSIGCDFKIEVFIYSILKHFLRVYSVPDTVFRTRDISTNKAEEYQFFVLLFVWRLLNTISMLYSMLESDKFYGRKMSTVRVEVLGWRGVRGYSINRQSG